MNNEYVSRGISAPITNYEYGNGLARSVVRE